MKIEFTAFPRSAQGTGASRRLRGAGKVPGIVYGADQAALPIELDHQALYRHLKMEAFHASILDMTYDGKKQSVLLRDVQMHPFKQIVLHVDFQRIDKNKKIHMKVPLHFINQESCPAVKLGGGVVNHIMNDIEIQCLPDALPEFIEVDVEKVSRPELYARPLHEHLHLGRRQRGPDQARGHRLGRGRRARLAHAPRPDR